MIAKVDISPLKTCFLKNLLVEQTIRELPETNLILDYVRPAYIVEKSIPKL